MKKKLGEAGGKVPKYSRWGSRNWGGEDGIGRWAGQEQGNSTRARLKLL